MDLPEQIAAVLSPHLGAHTADAVARHLLAKHGLLGAAEIGPDQAKTLHDTLRRGLVAFVGAEQAEELATRCLSALPR
ncbi:MAG TPA: hypothetical protein VII13_06095 [Vicinamibacteria bacterium]|jgi:hypothetical protein